jgi:hypothetical protein
MIKKAIFLVVFVLFGVTGFSQNFNFSLDYEVSYFLPKSNDTINIKVGNEGQYLYTDSKKVAESFKSSFRRFGSRDKDAMTTAKLFIDMSTSFMLMQMTIDDNIIWGHVDLTTFMNRGRPIDAPEEMTLVKKATTEIVQVNGKEFRVYEIAPNNKPDDVLYAAFDDSYDLNYNKHFEKLVSGAAGGMFKIDIPNGVLVYARDKKGNEIIRLLEVKENPLKGTVDLKFTLE